MKQFVTTPGVKSTKWCGSKIYVWIHVAFAKEKNPNKDDTLNSSLRKQQ